MNDKFKTALISSKQIKALFYDVGGAVDLVEQAFRIFNNGNVMLPDKISQIFDEKTQDRINCMTATLKDQNVCGMKWVSIFPNNPMQGIKNVSGVMILSELKHGMPIAVMDGTVLTSIRTAAVGACAVKHLARKNTETIGFIGAGIEARMHLDLIMTVTPNLKKCYVSSRTSITVDTFIKEEKSKHPQLEFIACGNDFRASVIDADIVITATSTQEALLKAKWIKKGTTYVHVGGWEDEFEVPKLADKIICDRWDCVKHRGQTICRMYKAGLLKDEDIYADFDEIVNGSKPSRENDDEFIYFNSVGLAFIDVYFANYIYQKMKDNENIQKFQF